jgi:hypothetical protein
VEFTQSGPDIIRSDNQRWLLDYWMSAPKHAGLPVWDGLQAGKTAIPLDDLSWTEVVESSAVTRFRIGFHGSRIAQAYGRENCVGKFLDEVLPPAYSNAALATYRQAVHGRLPVYTVSDMRDSGGRIVHYERLLLPFTVSGLQTERILASLETLSPEGAFEHRGLMASPGRPPAFALCTTIQN